MVSSSEKTIKKLWLDAEGVGRSNLGKSIGGGDSAGVNRPQSGRADIHPKVIELAKRRYGVDISTWPVQQLRPEQVDENTVVIALLGDVSQIPDFVFLHALDVFLAPIEDPFEDLDSMLEHTVSQIAWIEWLLSFVLTQRLEEVGTNRDATGKVIPRNLGSFEPINGEPEYSLANQILTSSRRPFAPTGWGTAVESRSPETRSFSVGSETSQTSSIKNPRRSFDEWGENRWITQYGGW